MKKIILSVFFVITVQTVIAQCDNKGITTNPDASINNERPAKRNTFFDWRTQYYQVNSNNVPATQIESPFYQGYQNSNVGALYTNKDMQPGDGWELISYDMGFNENGTPKNPKSDYVHLVLYNKYTGVLRVFLAGDRPQSFNGAQIQIQFSGTPDTKLYSALLSNASRLFGLDQFETNPKITSVTPYLNGLGKWFYSDFQMSYDACTCFYESKILIQAYLISQAQIDISGSFTGTIATTVNNSVSVSDPGYSIKDFTTVGQKAQKSYNSIQGFVSAQEKALQIEGKTNLELTIAQQLSRNSLNSFQQELKSSNFLKNGLKAVPYVAAALDIVNFFIGGGKTGDGINEVKIMPMSINATIDLKGTITTSSLYKDIYISTPGSKDAQIKDEKLYSYYNEVLGIFNLLTSPKIVFKYNPMTWLYNFQLITPSSSEIEYVINPAAGFNLTNSEIVGNIRYRGNGLDDKTGFLPLTSLNDFNTQFSAMAAPNWVQLEILLNLSRNGGQNVLIKYAYQLDLQQDQSFIYASPTLISRPSSNRDLVITNSNFTGSASAWNSVSMQAGSIMKPASKIFTNASQFSSQSIIPNPATATRINTFCNSSVYKDNPSRTPVARITSESDSIKTINKEQNFFTFYPNPANNQVTFNYFLGESTSVALGITDISGRSVAAIVNQEQEMGDYSLTFDTSNLPPGVYIVSFQTNKISKTEKLVVIK